VILIGRDPTDPADDRDITIRNRCDIAGYRLCMQDGLDPLARTALWTAAMRAREHSRDDRLFEEPLAALLATEDGPRIMRGFEGEVQKGVEDPALAVRTRFLDDQIRAAASSGIRQFVFVAAGMDTRAYRLEWPEGSTVYELDRPALLELKATIISSVDSRPGCSVRMVGVDLLSDWTFAVQAAGFAERECTLWLVEGLLYFLSPDERDSLLKELTALSASGSRLLADYVGETTLLCAARGGRRWRPAVTHGSPAATSLRSSSMALAGRRRSRRMGRRRLTTAGGLRPTLLLECREPVAATCSAPVWIYRCKPTNEGPTRKGSTSTVRHTSPVT